MERVIHTRVLRSEKGCKICVTHVLTRSDCVHTWDDTVRLDYDSRFVRVIYSSHIVSIKLGTVTPLRRCGLAVHERQDGPASMGLSALVQVSLPGGAARTRPDDAAWRCHRTRSDAAICASPSGAAHMSLGTATPLSAKVFETMLSTPAWISFWRCHPHAPPFSPCSSGSALCTCPDDASHASSVASPASVSLQFWHCFSQVL